MFALNFENVADSDGISIQDLIPGTTEGLKAGNAATGDEIQVYDPAMGGYKKFYLQYVTFPPAAMVNNYKWMDGSTPATYKFKSGDAFWYHSQGSEDVTVSFSGSVSLATSQTINIVNGYNMIGSSFPVNFNPNSLGADYWKNSGAVGGNAATGDEIQIYDPTTGGYTKYYLQNVTFPPAAAVNNWKWIAGSTPVPVDADVISIGKGAWYRHGGSGFSFSIPGLSAE